MSEYIVKLPISGAADEFFKTHEMPDMTLYGYPLTGEIVRCRDCAKADYAEVHMFDGSRPRKWTCTRFKGFYHMVQPDGFCSRGERREP